MSDPYFGTPVGFSTECTEIQPFGPNIPIAEQLDAAIVAAAEASGLSSNTELQGQNWIVHFDKNQGTYAVVPAYPVNPSIGDGQTEST